MSTPQILFSFRGRVPRKVFWFYGVLLPPVMLAGVVAEIVD